MTSSQVLLHYWGYNTFRPFQQEIIESVLVGQDTLALLPTGGGKSLTFQVPAMVLPGLTLVISPLVALMKDQTIRLKALGISAEFIHSGLANRDIDRLLDNCIYGQVKLLYISPERIQSAVFGERTRKMQVSLIAVDEAHCISQWGYDFRPSYLQLIDLRRMLPEAPVLALTATATRLVREDIIKQLDLRAPKVITASFRRPNIQYQVIKTENKQEQLLMALKKRTGAAIIYTRNRKGTEDLAAFLRRKGIHATFYHAGLTYPQRSKAQDDWIIGACPVMVATNAFGMGIDKATVRLVIHYTPPENLESYYQESGRAGRDEKFSKAIVLHQATDQKESWESFERSHPSHLTVRAVYGALGNYLQIPLNEGKNQAYEFDHGRFARWAGIRPITVYQAIRRLTDAGELESQEAIFLSSQIRLHLEPQEITALGKQNPMLEQFILLILRSFGGALNEFVHFNTLDMALQMGIPAASVDHLLEILVASGRADYHPKPEGAQLIFLRDRVSPQQLSLDVGRLEMIDETQKNQLKALWAYIENRQACRTTLLLTYFDETGTEACGFCDNCLANGVIHSSKLEKEQLRQIILERIDEGPVWIAQLPDAFSFYAKEKVLMAVQQLIEEGRLSMDSDFRIQRATKK